MLCGQVFLLFLIYVNETLFLDHDRRSQRKGLRQRPVEENAGIAFTIHCFSCIKTNNASARQRKSFVSGHYIAKF